MLFCVSFAPVGKMVTVFGSSVWSLILIDKRTVWHLYLGLGLLIGDSLSSRHKKAAKMLLAQLFI